MALTVTAPKATVAEDSLTSFPTRSKATAVGDSRERRPGEEHVMKPHVPRSTPKRNVEPECRKATVTPDVKAEQNDPKLDSGAHRIGGATRPREKKQEEGKPTELIIVIRTKDEPSRWRWNHRWKRREDVYNFDKRFRNLNEYQAAVTRASQFCGKGKPQMHQR